MRTAPPPDEAVERVSLPISPPLASCEMTTFSRVRAALQTESLSPRPPVGLAGPLVVCGVTETV